MPGRAMKPRTSPEPSNVRHVSSWVARAAFAVMLGMPCYEAKAYCVSSRDMVDFWSAGFPDLRIPVWVSLSDEYTSGHAGQSPQDIARLLIEVIAHHNETVQAPKLYFAGFTPNGFDKTIIDEDGVSWPAANLPTGITVMAAPDCDEKDTMCGLPAFACAGFLDRGPLGDGETSDPIGWVILAPAGCTDTYSLTSYPDLGQILLHELGHTLGLNHSNRTKSTCEGGGYVHGGPTAGTSSTMNSNVPAHFVRYRAWRRDDLEAFDHLYASATPPFELAWWEDGDYPNYPIESAATSLIGMAVSRTAVVSNRPASGVQALVSTAADGRVVHRLMNGAGELSPALADIVVDPGPQGRSWALPAVAIGDERVFVAWMADEAPEISTMTLRAAVRPTSEPSWQYSDHPEPFSVSRVAAGYDPGTKLFLVTTLLPGKPEVQLVLFNAEAAPVGDTAVLEGVNAYSVGAPLCEGGRCLIPLSDSAFGGPNYGVAEVAISVDASVELLSTEVLHAADSFGAVALVSDGQSLWGSTGERRFSVGSYPGLTFDGTKQYHNPNRDWAVGIGVWGAGSSSTRRLLAPRELACGNGIVQGAEECDVADATPGEGCDACKITQPPEPSADTGETGGGKAANRTDGCECRATSNGPGAGSMFGIVLVSVTRRRRKRDTNVDADRRGWARWGSLLGVEPDQARRRLAREGGSVIELADLEGDLDGLGGDRELELLGLEVRELPEVAQVKLLDRGEIGALAGAVTRVAAALADDLATGEGQLHELFDRGEIAGVEVGAQLTQEGFDAGQAGDVGRGSGLGLGNGLGLGLGLRLGLGLGSGLGSGLELGFGDGLGRRRRTRRRRRRGRLPLASMESEGENSDEDSRGPSHRSSPHDSLDEPSSRSFASRARASRARVSTRSRLSRCRSQISPARPAASTT
jgi:cysteine-rich repeat protein